MNEIINEILSLREDVERLKQINQSDDSKPAKAGSSGKHLEQKLGRSFARLITSGPSSAIRSLLNTSGLKSNFFSWMGIKGDSFAGGLIGGLWSTGISLLVSGVSRLFKKQRSPLLEAKEIEQIYSVNQDVHHPWYQRSIDSELFRGKGARMTLRESTLFSESLENQMRRGVVGL